MTMLTKPVLNRVPRAGSSLARRAVITVVAVASLSGGAVALSGSAGATTKPATKPAAPAPSGQTCSAAHRSFTYGSRLEASFMAKAAKAKAQEAKALKAGHARRAAHLAKVASHDQAKAAHVKGRKYVAKQAAKAAALGAACQKAGLKTSTSSTPA
jgi:hypothetical protein